MHVGIEVIFPGDWVGWTEKGRLDKEWEQKLQSSALTSLCQGSFQGAGEELSGLLTCKSYTQLCLEEFGGEVRIFLSTSALALAFF